MNLAHELGQLAENLAAEYLVSLGFRVLARNIRNKYGELDIAAYDTNTYPEELVVVEVRCRTLGKMQSPLESIGRRKINTLIRSSQQFVDDMNWGGFWRIDFVGITANNKKAPDDWELVYVKDITSGMNVSC